MLHCVQHDPGGGHAGSVIVSGAKDPAPPAGARCRTSFSMTKGAPGVTGRRPDGRPVQGPHGARSTGRHEHGLEDLVDDGVGAYAVSLGLEIQDQPVAQGRVGCLPQIVEGHVVAPV